MVNAISSRIQKFTKDGQYLSGFGKKGDAEGELEMPYGITIDQGGSIYIVDWGNDRVQKFSPDGAHLLTFGHSGKGAGSLDHPTGVCVDNEGDVYVVDWMNERVVIFNDEAKPLTYLSGDAVEVSPWGQMSLDANPDQANRRRQVDDLVELQKKFPPAHRLHLRSGHQPAHRVRYPEGTPAGSTTRTPAIRTRSSTSNPC